MSDTGGKVADTATPPATMFHDGMFLSSYRARASRRFSFNEMRLVRTHVPVTRERFGSLVNGPSSCGLHHTQVITVEGIKVIRAPPKPDLGKTAAGAEGVQGYEVSAQG